MLSDNSKLQLYKRIFNLSTTISKISSEDDLMLFFESVCVIDNPSYQILIKLAQSTFLSTFSELHTISKDGEILIEGITICAMSLAEIYENSKLIPKPLTKSLTKSLAKAFEKSLDTTETLLEFIAKVPEIYEEVLKKAAARKKKNYDDTLEKKMLKKKLERPF